MDIRDLGFGEVYLCPPPRHWLLPGSRKRPGLVVFMEQPKHSLGHHAKLARHGHRRAMPCLGQERKGFKLG